MIGLWLLGCGLGEVVFVGNPANGGELRVGWDDKARLIENGSISILDETGTFYASALATESGAFRVRAPAGQTIYAIIEGDGLLPAAFRGVSGIESPVHVRPVTAPVRQEDGSLKDQKWRALYGVDLIDAAAVRATFAGCPGVDEASSGAVFGNVRYALFDRDTGNVPPPVPGAVVSLLGEDGTERAACYLTADATAWDPAAEEAGAAGRFGVFGVPEGLYTLRVRSAVGATAYKLEYLSLYVPGDGVTPLFPLWVEFPQL